MVTVAVTSVEGVSLKGTRRRRWVGARLVETWLPWAHSPGCGCEPCQTYTCDRCGRRVGWCLGADDNMPGACDFCWHEPASERAA